MPEKLALKMKKLKIIQKNNSQFINILRFFFLILLFINYACVSNFEHTNKSNELIKISDKSFERINGYLSGNFYSYENKKKVSNAIGLYFALSNDGTSTAFSYCEDYLMTCDKTLVKIKTKLRCEKISNQNCFIIFFGDKFVKNKKTKIVKNKKNLENEFLIFQTSIKYKHQDLRISNSSETSDGSKWDN